MQIVAAGALAGGVAAAVGRLEVSRQKRRVRLRTRLAQHEQRFRGRFSYALPQHHSNLASGFLADYKPALEGLMTPAEWRDLVEAVNALLAEEAPGAKRVVASKLLVPFSGGLSHVVRRRKERAAEENLRELLQVFNLHNEARGITIQFHEINGRGGDQSGQEGKRNVARIFHYLSISRADVPGVDTDLSDLDEVNEEEEFV